MTSISSILAKKVDGRADFRPTLEQTNILNLTEATNDNLLVNALAGTGKTSTLDLVQASSPEQPVLCLAFNTDIAKEMALRFPPSTKVKTFNGLGYGIWIAAVGNVKLDKYKTLAHVDEVIGEFKGEDKAEVIDAKWEIIAAVSMAKSLGYVPDGTFPHAKRLITREQFHASLEEAPTGIIGEVVDHLLVRSITTAYKGYIDFNDQVYMPALFAGTFPRFPHVLVDEAQDLSPVNHAMLDKLVKGRLTVVGDRWQSIYGFRGAVTNGVEKVKAKFGMREAPLTVSFRCPRAIVENARWRVPGFQWIKEGGHVETLRSLRPRDIYDASAIICRNNAPLYRLAYTLLSNGRSVSVAGSDVGPRIIRLLKRIGNEADRREDLIVKIDGWAQEKAYKAQTVSALNNIRDMAECMKVFAGFGATLNQAIAYAEDLFRRQGTITLTTGHKAKGLEWDTVYFLDPWLIGSDEQELNLRYVIQTRSKERLYMIDSENIHP